MLAKLSTTTVLLSMLAAAGCGDDDPPRLYLEALAVPKIALQVNQSVPIKLRITSPAPEKTYVDIENPVSTSVKTNPTQTLALAKGEQQGVVNVTGVAATAGAGYHTITFKLRGTTSTQRFEIKVEGGGAPAPQADSAPPAKSDGGNTPDAAPAGG